MKVELRFLLCLVVGLLCAPLMAQDTVGTPTMGLGNVNISNIDNIQQRHWVVAGKVTTLQGDPVLGAKVVIEPNVAGEFRTLKTDFQGEFLTEYWLNGDLVREFSASVEVVKKGFLKARMIVDMGPTDKPQMFPITLRDVQEDPRLLSQADLISSLAPKLRQLGASDGLSGSGQKDYARGVEEFLDRRRPDRAVLLFNKVLRRDASCLECRTMLALAELDSGDWDGAQRNLGEVVTAMRADAAKGRSEPLVAYGVVESWRHQREKAAGFFIEALKFAPHDPLALQELGRSQLLLENWGTAASYLQKALDAGAGPEARLLRSEALLGGGDPDEASKEMTRYLNGRDVKAMPMHVRQLWAQVRERKKVETTYAKVKTEVDQPINYLRRAAPELKGLEPATDQSQLDSILSAVSKNVSELFQNFPNTSSLEQIHQEKVSRKGKVSGTREQKFRYLCFTPAEAWGPGFSEYRLNVVGDQGPPGGPLEGYMLTSGFASSSLLFHPAYLGESRFRFLGRQKINGRDTFVIAFAQQPARARSIGEFRTGQVVVPVFSQGLAWVDAESYQIIRMRTDLLEPLPEVKLKKETTEIDFGDVHFNRITQGFWLPREVTVTVDWNGRQLRNVHQYSDFKVFNVESSQRIGAPKVQGQASRPAGDPQRQ